jgi:hypothetical protein
MKLSSFGRDALYSSQAASSRSVYAAVIRSGGYFGSGVTGVARSAPTSNRSFWMLRSRSATAGAGAPRASAVPITLLASSTSA